MFFRYFNILQKQYLEKMALKWNIFFLYASQAGRDDVNL